MSVRRALVSFHLWIGVIAAPVLLVLGVTGALLVVEEPISGWLNPATSIVRPQGSPRSLREMIASVRRAYPGSLPAVVGLPQAADRPVWFTVTAPSEQRTTTVIVDPYTARVLGAQGDQRFFRSIRELHRRLLMGNRGNTVVLWMVGALVLLAITGPVVWWPRRRVGVRWDRHGWRRILDLHSLLGITSCAFLLAFAITGAVVHWDVPVQGWLAGLTGTSAPRVPQKLPTTVCSASEVMDADRLIGAATAALPGARPTALALSDDRSTPLKVWMKYPEDRTPNGRSILLLDPCTGRSLFTIDTRRAPVSYLYPREWNREIHTGDLFGWPTQVLAFLFSLGLAAMAVTGPLVWAMRRTSRRPAPAPPRRRVDSYGDAVVVGAVARRMAPSLIEAAMEDG